MIIVQIGRDHDNSEMTTIGYFADILDAEYFRDGVNIGLKYANNIDFKVEIKDE